MRATDTLFSTTAQFQILRAPTSSGGTTFGPGSANNLLKSNGTSVYWTTLAASDIPTISITDKTSGTLPVTRGGTGVTAIANIQAGKDGDGNTISSTYLKLSGGTLTGNITVTKAGDTYVRVGNTETGIYCFLDSDAKSSGGKHGIYSNGYWDGSSLVASGKWLIYRAQGGNVIVNGDCAGSAGSVAWGNVTGKPNRAGSDSDGGPAQTVKGAYTSNGGQQNPNYFGTNKVGFLMMSTSVNYNTQYKDWLIMDCYNGSDVGGSVAFGVNRQSLGAYIMRSAAERTSWAESAELLGTHNYTSYCPTKTGSGASGTWGISITGNAATATKATQDGDGNTISSTYLKLNGGTMTGTLRLNVSGDVNWFESMTDSTHIGGAILMIKSDRRWRLRQMTQPLTSEDGAMEDYILPAPTQSSGYVSYNILTSKSPVLIPQGGTGATDAPTARANLGVVAKSGDTMTGNLFVRNVIIAETSDSAYNIQLFCNEDTTMGIWAKHLTNFNKCFLKIREDATIYLGGNTFVGSYLNDTVQRQMGAASGAGNIFFYADGSSSGHRGIWAQNANGGKYLIAVDSNNDVILTNCIEVGAKRIVSTNNSGMMEMQTFDDSNSETAAVLWAKSSSQSDGTWLIGIDKNHNKTFYGNVSGNVTGTAANVTGVVAVAHGGTGNNGMVYKGSLTSSNNLDSIHESGYWYCLGSNCPASAPVANSYGYIINYHFTGINYDYQIYVVLSGGVSARHERRYNNGGWSGWKKVTYT